MSLKYDHEILPLKCSWIYPREHRVRNQLKVMVINAHPDDPDLLSGGLMKKLTDRGHRVKWVSVTNGELGHHKLSPIELAGLEFEETTRAAEVLGAEYECLNVPDGHVYVNREYTERMVRSIRRFDPDLIITHRPWDYHRDHRYTSQLVLDASYMLIVPHYCPDTPTPSRREMPIIMYSYDHFTSPRMLQPDVLLDIENEYGAKGEACIQHESQMMEWLPWTMKREDDVPPEYDVGQQYQMFDLIFMSVFSGVLKDYKELWKIGREKGVFDHKVKKGEIFELCEYGRQPTKKELKELFPGAYIPSEKEKRQWRANLK